MGKGEPGKAILAPKANHCRDPDNGFHGGNLWGIPWGGIPVATMANYKGARRGNPGSLEGRQATRKPF